MYVPVPIIGNCHHSVNEQFSICVTILFQYTFTFFSTYIVVLRAAEPSAKWRKTCLRVGYFEFPLVEGPRGRGIPGTDQPHERPTRAACPRPPEGKPAHFLCRIFHRLINARPLITHTRVSHRGVCGLKLHTHERRAHTSRRTYTSSSRNTCHGTII